MLLLTACEEGEFTCDDGSCIGKSSRCDLAIDCADHSDEMGCSVVLVPKGYAPKLPPPTIAARPVPFHVAINLTSIREFKLVDFKISADFIVRIRWLDSRLAFSNLRLNHLANEVQTPAAAWTPSVQVRDGTRSSVKAEVHSQSLYVSRRTAPLPDDGAAIREGEAVCRGARAGKAHCNGTPSDQPITMLLQVHLLFWFSHKFSEMKSFKIVSIC